MNDIGVMIWTRIPNEAYVAKTRIAKNINNQVLANKLSENMFDHILFQLSKVKCDICIYHNSEENNYLNNFKERTGNIVIDYHRYNNNLSWMDNTATCLKLLHNKGYNKALSIVSDCPYIDPIFIKNIIDLLSTYDVVLAPALDSGINIFSARRNTNLSWLKAKNVESRSENYNLIHELEENLIDMKIKYCLTKKTFPDIDTVDDVKNLWDYIKNKDVSDYSIIYNFLSSNKYKFKLE